MRRSMTSYKKKWSNTQEQDCGMIQEHQLETMNGSERQPVSGCVDEQVLW